MGNEDDPIRDDRDTGLIVHQIIEEDGAKEDNKSTEGDDISIETVDNEDELRGNDKPQAKPEEPAPPRPLAVRKLDFTFDGKHQEDGMVGSMIHEYCIGSVINNYSNLEATLSTP